MSHFYKTLLGFLFAAFTCCLMMQSSQSFSQVPTFQDCLGATPVCNQVYQTPSSTFGTGNYPNEQGPGSCLIPGEYNSSWYTFNITTSGTFAFTIIPGSPSADYDWAMYNLSNATCAEIQTNGSLMVSCNSSQYGFTGISATGVGNWNGAGPTNAFNALLNVTAGETYVLNINNWSGTNGGYTVDFSASSASIFDTVKPYIDTVEQVICNDNQLTFTFSENILCGSVQDADFMLTGPGGPYLLSSVTGTTCAAGGSAEVTFTASVSPAITVGGNYFLHITDLSGSVTDLCGLNADTAATAFFVSAVQAVLDSFVEPTCGGYNGEIYVSGTVGTPPYEFSMNGSLYQSAGSFTGLDSGIYYITVKDAFGCVDTVAVTFQGSSGAVNATKIFAKDINCFNACDGSISVSGSGGVPPYVYTWTNGAPPSANVGGLCPNTYKVTITDSYNCFDTLSIELKEPPEVHFDVTSLKNAVCYGYKDGSVSLNISGGNPPFTYVWTPYGGGSNVASGLGAGEYNLLLIDIHQCKYDTILTIKQPAPVGIVYPGDTTICFGTEASLTAPAVGGNAGQYGVIWDNGASVDDPYIVQPFQDETYTAVAFDDSSCFSAPQTYRVYVAQKPLIELGEDSILCYGNVFFKDVFFPGAEYLWQDGSIYHDYAIREPGLYTVEAYNSCFHTYDSIYVGFDDCGSCLHVPTAFTPNNDGLNDEFIPAIGCEFTDYDFKVFNRWGQIVFFTSDPNAGWNGLNGDQPSELGTYVWTIKYAGTEHGLKLSEQMSGGVVLIR
ncbi:MAG: gliding motility-associated C-terminal domain-containing protein [Chitinophagaceae bacterium]|nr:gliding motility-associated C-terminal domain-containing protein [Chitinophagaceae bacterium]